MASKFAVIRFSELGDRMDAGFHIARTEVKARLAELQATMTAEEAQRRVDSVALADKAALLVLCRGGRPALTTEKIDRAVREYPHLALALLENNLQPALERMRAKLAEDSAYLAALVALTKPEPKEE